MLDHHSGNYRRERSFGGVPAAGETNCLPWVDDSASAQGNGTPYPPDLPERLTRRGFSLFGNTSVMARGHVLRRIWADQAERIDQDSFSNPGPKLRPGGIHK